jgi:phenylacetate-CoA ligase
MKSWFLKKLVLPFADKTMGTSISTKLKQICKMREWGKDEIEAWQNQKLYELTQHAYHHTRYYKRLFDKLGIKPTDIQTKSDLNKLPKLTKKDIRENLQDLIPDNIESIAYKKASTGGSTGEPLKYYLDLNSWSFSNANTILNWEKAGYRYGDKYVALGSTSLFVEKKKSLKHFIYYKIKNKISLNGVNMSDEVCEHYVGLINEKKVKFIYGYASSIYLLAKFIIRKELKLDISTCFTTSEVLTNEYRTTIKKAFDSHIVNCYGAHDGGITAFSHKNGFFEVNYNSLLSYDIKDKQNTVGSLSVTDLFNKSLPMINYEIGDEVLVKSELNESYNYNGQILNEVLGRTTDIIELENGNVLTGPGFTILFKDIPVEYYFIEKVGVNQINCHIKKLESYDNKHEDLIMSTLKNQMGEKSIINILYTEKIFRRKSGKQKFFKS